jgi:hypothetical protein
MCFPGTALTQQQQMMDPSLVGFLLFVFPSLVTTSGEANHEQGLIASQPLILRQVFD